MRGRRFSRSWVCENPAVARSGTEFSQSPLHALFAFALILVRDLLSTRAKITRKRHEKEVAMRIGIIGMGNVGSALGRHWTKVGHDVTFGVRDPGNVQKQAAAEDMNTSLGSVHDAAQCEVILLAVHWSAIPDALKAAGDLNGKVLLDCTNPVNSDFTGLTMGHDTSAGEVIAKMEPRARVVKIFNTNGAKNMADTNYGPHRVTMFYAGNDAAANKIAAGLAADIGFEPIELGPLKSARLLEPLAMTWIILARHRGFGRDFAIDIVRRPSG
jgi:8-hydroxy-5-deazaflavin:NADPH oxidoreductase